MVRTSAGIAFAIVGLAAVPWLLACDTVPRQQSCRSPVADFSGVADVRIAGLTDGSPPPFVLGPQGGTHWEHRIVATGSRLGECLAQRSSILDLEGRVLYENGANVRASYDGTTLVSHPILFFPSFDTLPDEFVLRVETLGRVLEVRLDSRPRPPGDGGAWDADLPPPGDGGASEAAR